ncbi:MAG: BamA/TamA family outer membrane protein [Balneolaceae bacterium]|nr:BamA/TamA family outer membrane protein [Balneolaceae bacterium]
MDYSGSSTFDGRLRYALGNSQLRYFTESYGDTTLAELLSRRQTRLGVLPVHDFGESLQATIGKSYSEFYDDWRKHVNIYYNTLAGGMGRLDSLERVDRIPGTWIRDLAVSPMGDAAVLSVPSDRRPVPRLYLVPADSTQPVRALAEGAVSPDLAWSPDGRILAYSRTVRGEHGSQRPDLFLYDLEADEERRLTHRGRLGWPAFGPEGDSLVYVAGENGTANIWLRRMSDGTEERLTDYTGDVQIVHLAWNRPRNELVYHLFDADGSRRLVVREVATGRTRTIGEGEADNRRPVISPSGREMAFTSLRDEVPNVFVYDFESGQTRRVTDQFTGAEAVAWLAPDSSHSEGRIWVKGTESMSREAIWEVHASATSPEPPLPGSLPNSSWRGQLPPEIIPWEVEEDAALVTGRRDYNALANLTHGVTFGLPWYENPGDFGLMGFTSFTEPLGKHLLVGGGYLSLADPLDGTRGVVSYVNNTLQPTLDFSVYRTPAAARWYQGDFLVEEHAGGEVSATWPLNLTWKSYHSSALNLRLRYVQTDPLRAGRWDVAPPVLAEQADLRLGWAWKHQRPWEGNGIHPLDGTGVKFTLLGAAGVLGGDTSYLQPDLSAYAVLPALGMHRLFVYGRYTGQYGDALPQNYVGFSRYDQIQFPLPDEVGFLFENHVERVRGYREFVAGKHVAFGSLEYRVPLMGSLNTQVLGFIGMGQTTLSLFADAGKVWEPWMGSQTARLGLGAEVKNRLRLGPLRFTHAVGVGQPYDHLLGDSVYDLYYRVRAALPF